MEVNMATKLKKSRTDRVIDGVCGGIAEYFGIDSTIVRLAFVLLIFISGFGILLYIILVIIMPAPEKEQLTAKEAITENIKEIGQKLERAGDEIEAKIQERKPERARWLGIFLILLGLYFLLDRIGLFRWLKSDVIFSILLIVLGAWLLLQRSRGRT